MVTILLGKREWKVGETGEGGEIYGDEQQLDFWW